MGDAGGGAHLRFNRRVRCGGIVHGYYLLGHVKASQPSVWGWGLLGGEVLKTVLGRWGACRGGGGGRRGGRGFGEGEGGKEDREQKSNCQNERRETRLITLRCEANPAKRPVDRLMDLLLRSAA